MRHFFIVFFCLDKISFYLLDYVTRRSEKLEFQKKGGGGGILPDTTAKLFVFGVIRNQKVNYFETSVSLGKLHKNYDKWDQCPFFAITNLKKFSWCNVVKVKTCHQLKNANSIFQICKRCRQKFCLGDRCQRQPSANHTCVWKRLIDT